MSDFIKYDGDVTAVYVGPDGLYSVYVLVDPSDMTVRYVGQTDDVAARLSGHQHDKENFRKAAWIGRLANAGLKPIMIILTKCMTQSEVDAREYEVIDEYLDKGCDLYNKQMNRRIHFGVSQKTWKSIQGQLASRNTTISKLISKMFAGISHRGDVEPSSDGIATGLLSEIVKMSSNVKDIVISRDELVSFLELVQMKDALIESYKQLNETTDGLLESYKKLTETMGNADGPAPSKVTEGPVEASRSVRVD